jgi:hypothetical protein
MKFSRFAGWTVRDAAVAAGTIASRKGNESVAPMPRKRVRRDSALRVR